MRFLLDENVSAGIASFLKKLGFNVSRVPSGTKNGEVIALAQKERRILITRDANFLNTALYPPSRYAGIVYVRIHPPSSDNIAPPLGKFLRKVKGKSLEGKLVVLSRSDFVIL